MSVSRFYPDADLIAFRSPDDAGWGADYVIGCWAIKGQSFVSEHSHGRSLNGIEGCLAVVKGLLRVAREFEPDWILKIDSDTLWLKEHWIFPTDEVSSLCLIGSEALPKINGRWPYASGAAYFVNAEALLEEFPDPDAVEDQLQTYDRSIGYRFSSDGWHEDRVVTSRLLQSERPRILIPFGTGGLDIHNFASSFEEAKRNTTSDFREFGRRPTGVQLEHMTAWLAASESTRSGAPAKT